MISLIFVARCSLDNSEWINLGDAADFVGVHPTTMRAWADKGEISSQRTPGGHRRFRRQDLEAWVEAQSHSQQAGAQLLMQNALGQARFKLTEGDLNDQEWYQQLDEKMRTVHQQNGRRLLQLIMHYTSANGRDQEALEEAREIGRSYEEMGRSGGLSLAETVRAYLFFREFLFQTIYDMTEASGSSGPTDWGQIRQLAGNITNEVLLALIDAHPCRATQD
jgi:excisionase family DNA binding protein